MYHIVAIIVFDTHTHTHTAPHTVLRSGMSFGELSFLRGSPASMSVVAREPLELYVIEGYFVQILFGIRPGLAARFYHFIARVLAEKLLAVDFEQK